MKSYVRVLKLVAPVFFVVGALHLILGPGADVMLGARLSAATLGDAVLDSQNRFYGVAFTVYGVLLLLCASDLNKYQTVLRCVLCVFFAAGLARYVSIAISGWPTALVLALLVTEIVAPPVLLWWLSRLDLEG